MMSQYILITPTELEALIQKACELAVSKALATKKTDVDFLTVPEAAKLLRVSAETIYRMVDTNDLEYRKFGKSIRIVKQSLFK